MDFVLHLFGREVLALSVSLPEVPQFSDVTSLIASEREELEDDGEYEEEPESRKVRLGFRQMTDR